MITPIKMKESGKMNIVETYENEVCEMYMRMHPNIDRSRVYEIVRRHVEDRFIDIPCKMDNNMTHECFDTTMTKVFDWIDETEPIISGNATFFKQHEEYLSPTVLFLETEGNNRGILKKQMYQFEPSSIEYKNLDVGQGNVKVIMNADYGGSGTTLSPFYSVYIPPATAGTAKNMTTTLICCLELLSANRNKWALLNGINELYDFIRIVLTTDTTNRDLFGGSFTTEQVTNRLLAMVYHPSMSDRKQLTKYIDTLPQSQKNQLMLAYNMRLVLTMYLHHHVESVMHYLKLNKMDFSKDLTDESVFKAGYGVKMPPEIESDMRYIMKMVLDNCVYPYIVNDGEARAASMTRLMVCVTDTDSLMVHFAHFLDEFQAHVDNFRDSCLIASAFGMRLIVEAVIPKMVENITNNMGIKDKYYRDKFVFKNEFAFLSMSLFAKKMYSASCMVQEGHLRNIHNISVTGLSFKKRDSAEFLEPIMLELHDKYVLTTEKINVAALLDEYEALKEKLLPLVTRVTSYHKTQSTKKVESYDPTKTLPSQMRGAIIWNNMFPDEKILPMDRVFVIPLSYAFMERNMNPTMRRLYELLSAEDPSHKKDPYISLPETYEEIPDWLSGAIDPDFVVDKLLTPFKQLLGLFDVVIVDTKGGCTAARMIYI